MRGSILHDFFNKKLQTKMTEEEFTRFVVRNKQSLLSTDERGYTPLMLAVEYPFPGYVYEILLQYDKEAQIRATSNDGFTASDYAIVLGNVGAFLVFLRNSAVNNDVEAVVAKFHRQYPTSPINEDPTVIKHRSEIYSLFKKENVRLQSKPQRSMSAFFFSRIDKLIAKDHSYQPTSDERTPLTRKNL